MDAQETSRDGLGLPSLIVLLEKTTAYILVGFGDVDDDQRALLTTPVIVARGNNGRQMSARAGSCGMPC